MSEGVKTLAAGEFLFLQGQEGHEIYFLKSGRLEVLLSPSRPDLTPDYVNTHGQAIEIFDQPGQLIGELSPILNCPRTASIRAAAESSLIVADMKATSFENAIRVKPALGIKIAEELARRINKTNDRLKKQDLRLLRFLEEVRLAMTAFWDSHAGSLPTDSPEVAGNVFVSLAKLCRGISSLPADLPVSLSMPYNQASSFFAYFGGISFQTPKTETHSAGAAEALAKIQGKKYATGEVLCSAGDDAKELFILLAGRLNVVVGRRIIQTIQGRGKIVGEMAFLLKTRRTASVVAVEPSTLLVVPYEKMEPLFQRVPPLLVLMLKELGLRLLQVDTLLQKSAWRNLFFSELLPNFCKAFKEISESLPASLDESVRDAAQKTAAMIDEAASTMSRGGGQEMGSTPFSLSELLGGSVLPPAVNVEELSDALPDKNSPREHVDFVLSMGDGRFIFGPAGTLRTRFAQYLNVDEKTLVPGRIVGKIGEAGTYVEVLLDEEGTPDSRTKLVEQMGAGLGVEYFMLNKEARRWMYQYQGGAGGGAVSADVIPHATKFLEILAKVDRNSFSLLDRARVRRLYLEAVAEIMEAHWSSPGKFSDLAPAEFALMQFGVTSESSADNLKLDPPPGRTVISVLDFAKRVVVQHAGGETALMGGPAAAKAQLPEKEKQIAGLIESRKKAYADHQVPYEDSREAPLILQIEKKAQMQRLKEKGGGGGAALRDFATIEKETEKILDERNAFVGQKLKGDANRKALTQIKGIEDQLRTAFREKSELVEIVQMPADAADAQKEKNAVGLMPINLLNGFRDLLMDFYERIRQTLKPENLEVTPLYTDGVRLYGSRDVGIALQKITEKDKAFMGGQDFPAILRLPGEGYSIYSPDWHTLIIPFYVVVDPFQMMAHGVGEWRWSKIPEAEQKKYQKAFKGGSSIKLDQLGIYFARDYRMLLDGKDIDEGSAKFINTILTMPVAPDK